MRLHPIRPAGGGFSWRKNQKKMKETFRALLKPPPASLSHCRAMPLKGAGGWPGTAADHPLIRSRPRWRELEEIAASAVPSRSPKERERERTGMGSSQ